VTSFIRFRAPIDPFLVMLAAVLLVDIRADLARLRRQWAALGEADRERRKAAQAGEPTPM
jgi:hypothetical protein